MFTSGERNAGQSEQLITETKDKSLINTGHFCYGLTHLGLLPVRANCFCGDTSLWVQWADRQIAASWSSPMSRLYSCHDVRGYPGNKRPRMRYMPSIQHLHGEPCRELWEFPKLSVVETSIVFSPISKSTASTLVAFWRLVADNFLPKRLRLLQIGVLRGENQVLYVLLHVCSDHFHFKEMIDILLSVLNKSPDLCWTDDTFSRLVRAGSCIHVIYHVFARHLRPKTISNTFQLLKGILQKQHTFAAELHYIRPFLSALQVNLPEAVIWRMCEHTAASQPTVIKWGQCCIQSTRE